MATIQDIRYELLDTDVTFPILADDEIAYYLSKNNNALTRTAMDCARAILFKLSMRNSETVDIFSVRSDRTADSYRQALLMYIKDPNLNPALNLAGGYAGGISKSDMQANVDNTDNNAVRTPLDGYNEITTF